ncbi:MAG: SIS domain-containing protein [Methanomassiliicoccaceae archaeon]|jgi:6-phospho-3-hexuloisomerase|nr:SIS domain-containing protein [Methanomassiliicoccaceae archaeon]
MPSIDYIIDAVKDAVAAVDPKAVDELIDNIIHSKTVFVFGVGRSGLAGQFFCVRLVQMGLDVHFVGEMTTPIITKDDLTILISGTGNTMSAVQTANIARRIGSKVMAVTARADTKLAIASDSVILLPEARDKERSKYAPLGTIFENAAVLFLDSIVPMIMERLGLTESDMRKRHAIWV